MGNKVITAVGCGYVIRAHQNDDGQMVSGLLIGCKDLKLNKLVDYSDWIRELDDNIGDDATKLATFFALVINYFGESEGQVNVDSPYIEGYFKITKR